MRWRSVFGVLGALSLVAFAPTSTEACWWSGGNGVGGYGYRGGYGPGIAMPYYHPAPTHPLTVVPTHPMPLRPHPAVFANVTAKDNAFDPVTINIQPGTTIRWTNAGMRTHTVTANDGKWDSGDIPHGASYNVTFVTTGTYKYHCKHNKGMEGTIVVGEQGKEK
jgi:hypothetical protein